jgi:hypothetical protein
MLLLSNDGLLLADYYSEKPLPSHIKKESILEITAPQFTILYKIFSEFQALRKNEAIFKIANSNIYITKFELKNIGSLFLLFVIDELDKKNVINKELPKFFDRTKDLMIGYI